MDDEVRRKIEANGLPVRRWMEMFAEYDQDMFATYVDWWTRARRHVEIDAKIREFVSIAIDAVVQYPGIDTHIHMALDAGATVQELVDVVIVAGRLKGPHVLNYGLTAVDRVVQARQADGRPTPRRRKDIAS